MFKKIIIFLLLICSIINIGLSIYSGVLPSLYLVIFVLIELQLDLLAIFLIKRKNKIFSVLGRILGIVLILLFILIGAIFFKVQDIFESVTSIDTEVSNYSLVVLSSSDYYTISDVYDKNLGILNTKNEHYNEAFKNLKTKGTFKETKYDNEYLLANGLLNKDVEVILLNEAYISILDEGIKGFADNIRILEDARVEVEMQEKVSNDNKVVNVKNNEAFNVYISGIDTYGNITSVSRSDVNIIATINPSTGKILLTNVPRDMYVSLAGTNGSKDKLTHAGVYGINTSIETLENFLDIDISYYVRINFSSLIKLVDYIGGIDVYSSYDFKSVNRYYKKGMNYNLTGEEALYFSRNRYAFSDGDRQRGRNQEQVIAAIIKKITASRDVNVYFNLINTLENSFQTNMDKNTINNFIYKQLENNYNWDILFSDVNGYDSSNYTYSYPWQKLYVMEVDNNSLNNAKNKINSVLNGN